MIKNSLSVLLATVTLIPASSLLCSAIAANGLSTQPSVSNASGHQDLIAQNYIPMYTPDFMMSVSAQRALELRLESMRGKRGSSSNSSGSSVNLSSNSTSSKKTISAKKYRTLFQKLQQKFPGHDTEIKQVLNRMYEVGP
jgi:hypothetical protein